MNHPTYERKENGFHSPRIRCIFSGTLGARLGRVAVVTVITPVRKKSKQNLSAIRCEANAAWA